MLHSVAGIVEERDIRTLDLGGEASIAFPWRPVGIEADSGIKAELLQGRRHVLRVVARIGQHRHVAIAGVADHQRTRFSAARGDRRATARSRPAAARANTMQ